MHSKRMIIKFPVHNTPPGDNLSDYTFFFPRTNLQSDELQRGFVRRIALQSQYWYTIHSQPVPRTWAISLSYVYLEAATYDDWGTDINSIDIRTTEDPRHISIPPDVTDIWRKVVLRTSSGVIDIQPIHTFTFAMTGNAHASKIRAEWIAQKKKLALPVAKTTRNGRKYHLCFAPISTSSKPADATYALDCEMEVSI